MKQGAAGMEAATTDGLERLRTEPKTVICIGLSALDYIWQVDRLPCGEHTKVKARDFVTKGGGMAATAAVTVARLGSKALFWGRAGDDHEGLILREELRREGVNTEHFRLFKGARSSISGVVVDETGERHIANFRGADLPVSPAWLPLDLIAGAGSVLSDPRWPEGTVAAFCAARARGVPTVLDADVADAEVFEEILPLTDHAVFSAPALSAFAGGYTAQALAKVQSFGCVVSAVTQGSDGVLWQIRGETQHLPAFRVPVVDTNGAGDVFHGAYALAVAASMPVAAAMEFASIAAALKCTKPDGRSGIPTLDEVIEFQRKEA